jgi:hypothetical protein
MVTNPVDVVELRKPPKRPFGVYVIIFLLLTGVLASVLEILRVHGQLGDFLITVDEVLRERNVLVFLAHQLFADVATITVANGIFIAGWIVIILGLWTLQRWAWVTMMILTGIVLTIGLVRYFQDEPAHVNMLVNVAFAFYLNDSSVRRAFIRPKAGDEARI